MPNVAARAAAAWRPCRFHALNTGLAARQTSKTVARRGGGLRSGQPRCARGNLKGRPKAWTKMTKGKSGAGAPDRNRGRPLRKPPPRRATYEDQSTHEEIKSATQKKAPQETTPAGPHIQNNTQGLAATASGTGFPHPPPIARIKSTADLACSPLSCTDTRCCNNTLRSASITSR